MLNLRCYIDNLDYRVTTISELHVAINRKFNAAAVIGTPIAIEVARQLGLPEEAFVLSVLFGANMSYATPIAYKTNLLIMSAGGYRFTDFIRVGVPLTLIMWGVLSWLLTILYDLG